MNLTEKLVADSTKLQSSKWGKYRLTIKKMQHVIALSSAPPHVLKHNEKGSEQINNNSNIPTEGFRGLKRIAKGVSTIQKLDLSLDSNPSGVSEKMKVLRNFIKFQLHGTDKIIPTWIYTNICTNTSYLPGLSKCWSRSKDCSTTWMQWRSNYIQYR